MTARPCTVLAPLILAALLIPVGELGAGNPFAGEKIYARYCLNCHGAKGRGQMAGTPDFSWRGAMHNGLGTTDPELSARILQGKGICPGFRGILSDEDVSNVITHLRTLR